MIFFIKSFEQKEIINQTNEQIDVLLDGVKVTFFNAKWSFLKPIMKQKLNIASIEQIAAMKVNVLFLRAKYRDYYDMYFLVNASSFFEDGSSSPFPNLTEDRNPVVVKLKLK